MGRKSRNRMEGPVLTIRCSPEEYEKIKQRAATAGFKTTAEWARRRLLGDDDPSPPPADDGSDPSHGGRDDTSE